MEFVKTQEEFPSIIHRFIFQSALRQTPLEVSLADTGEMEEGMITSCRQYYDFIMNMLSMMYEDPFVFGMKAGEYDAFLNGRTENAMKQKMPAKTLAIRSETYNAVYSYFRFLQLIAYLGEVEEGTLFITKENYDLVRKDFDDTFQKKKNARNHIKYEVRLNGLKELGLHILENEDDKICVTNTMYPQMFLSMSALAKAGWGKKPYGEHNFVYTDFRQIWDGRRKFLVKRCDYVVSHIFVL